MLNKRGGVETEVYFFIFGIVIIILSGVMVTMWANNAIKSTYFEKSFLSKDLALLTNTILASPGNIVYTYYFDKANISKFNYELENNAFIVSEAEKGTPIYYFYAEDRFRGGELKAVLPAPKQLQLSLTGNDFEIGEDLLPSFNKLVCRGIDTKDEEWKKKEIVITGDNEINKEIKDKANFHKFNIKTKKTGKTDLLIKIVKNENDNTIKAYVDSEKNNKLACLIINKFDNIRSVIIPSDEFSLDISSNILGKSFVPEIYSGIEDYFTK